MVDRIVRQFDPDRIILFGSHARGDAGPDSDVDLLIVMPVEGSRREMAVEIGVALHDVHVAKDLIVTRPEDFEWRKEVVGTIERPAWREGKVLYDRIGKPDHRTWRVGRKESGERGRNGEAERDLVRPGRSRIRDKNGSCLHSEALCRDLGGNT